MMVDARPVCRVRVASPGGERPTGRVLPTIFSPQAELAEHIAFRAADRCVALLEQIDVSEHVRCLISPRVLEVEADILVRTGRGHPF
jgi:hypothetical protein